MDLNVSSRELLWEKWAKIAANWLRENRVPFFSTLVIGFLAHGFVMFNLLPNHDGVFALFSKGTTTASGRWGLELLQLLFPNYSMPWIYGVITLGLMSIAVCLMAQLLGINSKLLQGLLGGCVIAFPSLTGTFAYMFTASSYAVAFLLAVFAVWTIKSSGGGTKQWLIAGISLLFSLSIYQAYLSITASLLIIVLIQDILDEKKVPSIFIRGVGYVLFLLATMGTYYGLTILVQYISGISFGSYAQDSLNNGLNIFGRIAEAYLAFFNTMRFGQDGLIGTPMSQRCHIIAAIMLVLLLLCWLIDTRGRSICRIGLLAGLLLVFPVAADCIYLVSAPLGIHTLVRYGFAAFYILTIALIGKTRLISASKWLNLGRNIAVHVTTAALAVVILCNVYVANEAYLKLYLDYEKTYGNYVSIISSLQATPGFQEDTKVAFVREPKEETEEQTEQKESNRFSELTGIMGAGLKPYEYIHERFLDYFCGLSITLASDAEIKEIEQMEQFIQMPVYPYNGSIAQIGDMIVVKIPREWPN